jgi:hypothetical protein
MTVAEICAVGGALIGYGIGMFISYKYKKMPYPEFQYQHLATGSGWLRFFHNLAARQNSRIIEALFAVFGLLLGLLLAFVIGAFH